MNTIHNITTERVDDTPLLIEEMKRMELPTLIDQHFLAHGNWYGLSMGWVSTVWLSSIISQGDHRLSHLEPWVAHQPETLKISTGQEIERLDFTDDRVEIVLRHFSDDEKWARFESRLNQNS
jgi:transposase